MNRKGGRRKKKGGRRGHQQSSKPKLTKQQVEDQQMEERRTRAAELIHHIDPFVHQATLSKDVSVERYSMSTPDGATPLLQKVDIKLTAGRRYGLVGKNGSGKTTLLRNIASYAVEDFPLHIRMVHVAQEHEEDDYTVEDSVLHSDTVRTKLMEEQERLEIEQSLEEDESKSDDVSAQLDAINAHIEQLELEKSEEKASRILKGLGFTNQMQKLKTKDLSGGWRMRVELAKALFINPDLMLLDEPTNHLDFPAVLWLQEYLTEEFDNTLVIVSHDRTFLNAVITNVIFLNQQLMTLEYYKGDYNQFEKTRSELLTAQKKLYDANMLRINAIKEYLEKTQHQGPERQKQRTAKKKDLARLVAENVEDVKEEKSFSFRFPEVDPEDLGAQQIVTLDRVSFGYTPEKIILRDIDLAVDMDSRVGVLGANGVGKSTLIKLMMGQLEPVSGHVDKNRQARIAYFTQHHYDQLDFQVSAVEYLLEKFKTDLAETPDRVQKVRRYLGRFRISGDRQNQKMKFLSGGQKSRVAFAVLTFRTPHLIIMDEPTNHLDLETVDALIEAIKEYQGGVLVISHDQHFLSSCCEQWWSVTPDRIRRFRRFESAKKFALQKRIDEIHYC